MSKRTYRGDSVAKSEETGVSGNSRKVLRKSELDKIASEEGFHFLTKLKLGNTLYANNDGTLKRVYDKYGKVVSTYTPKGCLQNTVEFHNPTACSPAVLSNSGFRQYTGNSKRVS